MKAAIAADPERAAKYAQRYGRTVAQLPGALSLFHEVAGELKKRAGGEPFDNRNHIYVGFGDDVALNRSVKRYTAIPSARDYVRQYATPTGRISDPILTIHTTSDALVLGSDVTAYEVPAAIAGTSDRFVARFVEANGHCNFTPAQTGNAFDALLAWARDGKRPAGGRAEVSRAQPEMSRMSRLGVPLRLTYKTRDTAAQPVRQRSQRCQRLRLSCGLTRKLKRR